MFAFPTAIFPFLADDLDADRALGLLYSAGAVGSLLVSLTSGWYSRVHRHGRLVLVAAALTGAAVAGAGHARVRRPHRSTCERGQGRYSRGLTPYWRLNAELRAKAVL